MNSIEFLPERVRSDERISHIWSLLDSGVLPVVRLRPRKGVDSRLMRVTDSDRTSFFGVFIDEHSGARQQPLHLPYTSILNGTIMLEEVDELNE